MPTLNWISLASMLGETTAKASVILLLAFGVTRLLRHRSAAFRHMVWLTAFGAALAMFPLPSLLPAWPILPADPAHESVLQITPLQTFDNHAVETGSVPVVYPDITPKSRSSWPGMWIALWLLGVGCSTIYFVAGRRQLRRLVRRASPAAAPDWRSIVSVAAKQLRVRRHVTLLQSPDTDVPLTCGLIRPRLVLPADAEDWQLSLKQAAIQHEMAHIARLDTVAQLVAQAACTLYWFHPLVWIAARASRLECERACDDHVVAAGCIPSQYAGDLLALAGNGSNLNDHAAGLAMAQPSHLEGRLLALLNPTLNRRQVSRTAALVLTGLTALLVLPLAAISTEAPPLIATLPALPQAPAPQPTVEATPIMPITKVSARLPATRPQRSINTGAATGQTGFECEGAPGSYHLNSDSDDNRYTLSASWSRGGCTAMLNSQGQITFAADFSGVLSIAPGGFIDITTDTNGDVRQLSIRPSADGSLTYAWSVAGRPQEFESGGREWLARFLVTLDRQTAYAVKLRLPSLLQEGGAQRVLDEVSYMSSGNARSVYLLQLLSHVRLQPGEVQRALSLIPGSYGHAAAQVLVMMARQGLIDDSTQAGFLSAADNISADYEHARVLLTLLDSGRLEEPALFRIIQSVAQIHADHEASRVLIAVARQQRLEGSLRDTYWNAAQSIRSEGARNQALNAIRYF